MLGSSQADTFAIRRCGPSDAPTIAALGARLFAQTYGPTHPEPELSRYLARTYSVEVFTDAIAEKGAALFLAEDQHETPIGYAYLRPTSSGPEGVSGKRLYEIVRFYVDGSTRRRGVGRALMDQCLAAAREADADMVWLQVAAMASWAIAFYTRMGFTIVGRSPFYFGDRVDDDYNMSLAL